jgi:hypothetical protein
LDTNIRKLYESSKANFAKVYVNGTYIGLYTNVESISKKFVDGRFGSKTNAFLTCSHQLEPGPKLQICLILLE